MSHYAELADQFLAYQSEWFEEPRQADLKSRHDTWEEAARAADDGAAGRTPFVGQESTGRWWKLLPEGRWVLVADKSGAQVAANQVIRALHEPGQMPDAFAIAKAAYLRGMNAANHGVPSLSNQESSPASPDDDRGRIVEERDEAWRALRYVYERGVMTGFDRPDWLNKVFSDAYAPTRATLTKEDRS